MASAQRQLEDLEMQAERTGDIDGFAGGAAGQGALVGDSAPIGTQVGVPPMSSRSGFEK